MLGLQGCLSLEMLPGHGIRHLLQHRVAPTPLDAPTVLRWAHPIMSFCRESSPTGKMKSKPQMCSLTGHLGQEGLKELGQEL